MSNLSGKKLIELYNECVGKKNEIENLSKDREFIEKEIEHRLRIGCSAYDDICKCIENLGRWDGLNYIGFSRCRSEYDGIRLNTYTESKTKLRKWLLDNPRFVEEFVGE